MGSVGAVRELIEERPDLEPAIEAVLRPEPPFTFDDLEVDSGRFGELVARGVVEKVDEGYRVADPDAVRRGLAGDLPEEPDDRRKSLSLPSLPVTRLEIAYLAGAVALVVAFRLFSLPSVYHGGHVVLSSNDPYYYRYLVEQLLTNPETTPGNLGFGVSRGEPLLVTVLWLATRAFGGTVDIAGHVLAWYPVVSAAITAVLVYALAVIVTDDRRVGLASVAMLAVIPGHAVRTGLGFADHHAFDYVWLAVTLLALAVIARDARRGRSVLSTATVAAVATVAVGVAGQTLAWDNSPLLLIAIGGYLGLEGLRSVHVDARPGRTIGPVVVGLAAGAVLTFLAHDNLGWHTTLVTSAPTLLVIGGVGVLLGAVLVDRLDLQAARGSDGTDPSAAVLAVLEAVGLITGALALQHVRPAFWGRLTTSLQSRLLAPRPIAEVVGLFGEGVDWLLLLGFALFLGVPYLLWASVRAVEDGRWLPPVVYAWYFLGLSVIQVRFVGELAPALALFTGLGLVHLAERIDVARLPAPFSRDVPPGLTLPSANQFGALVILFLLVGSLGIIQVPIKTAQTTIDPAQSEAAFWMAEYSEKHDIEYPSNYVFSEWGRNRMYNYFVSGESRSYGYAQANFGRFISSTEPAAWYDSLGNRRGFVVTTSADVGGPRHIGTRLHRYGGFRTESNRALAHYRFLHATGDGEYKIFRVVPGAVIRGTTDADVRVTARARVEIDGRSYTYVRWTSADANGSYRVRVAQPGEYRVAGSRVTVNESAVNDGLTVPVD